MLSPVPYLYSTSYMAQVTEVLRGGANKRSLNDYPLLLSIAGYEDEDKYDFDIKENMACKDENYIVRALYRILLSFPRIVVAKL